MVREAQATITMNPDLTFLIVGAGKAASTRIFKWLDEHPQVCMAHPKEPQIFSLHYDVASRDAWEQFFQHYRGEPQVGEATPGYLHLPYVPRRIAATCPEAKILVSLRHPVERAYSDWWMHHARGDDAEGFERAMRICLERSDRADADAELSWVEHANSTGSGQVRARPYLEIGHYDEHLARYREHLAEERIKAVLFDDVRESPEVVYGEICEFLGIAGVAIDSEAVNPATNRLLERARRLRHGRVGRTASNLIPRPARAAVKALLTRHGAARPPMPAGTRAWLLDYYAPHNERLAHTIGRDLSHWNS